MKYKIISTLGITAAILLFVFDSAMALYDLGTGEVEYGITYFDRYPFSWNAIDDWDWWLWGAKVVWYALLIIPWIQYFNAVRMEGRLGRTLAADLYVLKLAILYLFSYSCDRRQLP